MSPAERFRRAFPRLAAVEDAAASVDAAMARASYERRVARRDVQAGVLVPLRPSPLSVVPEPGPDGPTFPPYPPFDFGDAA